MARSAPEPQGMPADDEAGLAAIAQVLAAVAEGDLEQRVPVVSGGPAVQQLRWQFNRVLDVTDAFVRESGVSLSAAAEGRFHRRLLVQGLPGSFRRSADLIDGASRALARADEALAAQTSVREALVSEVVEVSGHVAAASTELGASAESLAASVRAGVEGSQSAVATVRDLEESSARIEAAVGLIRLIAGRTRMLALNATIEAARAGAAGLGFAVVAAEVKALADNSASASDDISAQVAAVQQAAAAAAAAMAQVVGVIHEMDGEAAGIAAAAGGGDSGLARMAEVLSTDIARFAELG